MLVPTFWLIEPFLCIEGGPSSSWSACFPDQLNISEKTCGGWMLTRNVGHSTLLGNNEQQRGVRVQGTRCKVQGSQISASSSSSCRELKNGENSPAAARATAAADLLLTTQPADTLLCWALCSAGHSALLGTLLCWALCSAGRSALLAFCSAAGALSSSGVASGSVSKKG